MGNQELDVNLLSVGELDDVTTINRRDIKHLRHSSPVSVDMKVKVVPDTARSQISLIVSCSYLADIYLIRTRLAICAVIATFEVADLPSKLDIRGNEVAVDSRLMMLMLGIAVGALRGIMAVRLKGTALENHPLPIIDMGVLMSRLSYTS